MILRRMFPCMLMTCFALSAFALSANAQTETFRPRHTITTTEQDDVPTLENDPVIVSLAEDEDLAIDAVAPAPRTLRSTRFEQLLASAIDSRLGSPYVWGATGPRGFDCSGFVWSSFQQVGIYFDRESARHLWSRFAPARETEEFKFGTLVFFSGLTHIGIVADDKGFYHASRHHGVVYAPFNKYWLARIDGFRRVPMPA
ncbi:MAG: C40 family peptidase, partial [Pyrinomonadaceae bacterium]